MSEQKAWTGGEEHVGVKKDLSRVVCFPIPLWFLAVSMGFQYFHVPLAVPMHGANRTTPGCG